MEKAVIDFLRYVRMRLSENNMKLRLEDSEYVLEDDDQPDTDGNQCAGWFDEHRRELVVAVKHPNSVWVPILAHEFGHFLQWASGFSFCGYEDRSTELYDYVEYGNTSRDRAFECVDIILRVELDAEHRTLGIIRDWSLPIDVPYYKQGALAHMILYKLMAHTRQWHKKSLYDTPELIRSLPAIIPPTIYDIPHFRQFEKLFYVYRIFDPRRAYGMGPNLRTLKY
jgi:hypothetical protein